MENFKGTTGKWYFEASKLSSISPNGEFKIKAGKVGTPVAILPLPIGRNGDKQFANAKLISKAPEMLEMLKELEDCVLFPVHIHIKIRKIIKEAT